MLTAHLHDFINAYNYGRRLKTLRGLTPYEYICKCWTNEPERFSLNPHHQMPGPNSEAIEQRCSHLGIAEHAGPLAEAEVGGDDDARLFVELAEQVAQQGPA